GHVASVVARKRVERFVNREIQCLVRKGAWNWRSERKTLSQRLPTRSDPKRFFKQNRYGGRPIQAKRGVGHFVKQVQVFDRSVVEAESRPDTGFARTAKDLAQCSVAKSG